MSLSNTLKYKIDTNSLLIGDNVAEVHHQSVILTDFSGEVPDGPHLSNSVILCSYFSLKSIEKKYNGGQDIRNKVKKSNKIAEEQKTLIYVVALFLTILTNVSILEERLGPRFCLNPINRFF